MDPDRLLPDRLPADHGREPHLGPAGARHVQERPDPQGDPGRLRLPAALGAGQPAAHLRGVRGPHEPGGLHERHARSVRDGARRSGWPSSSSGPPAWSTRRSRCGRPTGQIDDLINEIRETVGRGERVLVTTLTKKMAEDLADYLAELGIKVQWLHSEVDTLERSRSCATCAWACTTCWSASTCCAKGWTCRR